MDNTTPTATIRTSPPPPNPTTISAIVIWNHVWIPYGTLWIRTRAISGNMPSFSQTSSYVGSTLTRSLSTSLSLYFPLFLSLSFFLSQSLSLKAKFMVHAATLGTTNYYYYYY